MFKGILVIAKNVMCFSRFSGLSILEGDQKPFAGFDSIILVRLLTSATAPYGWYTPST
jgi:hypothetical protein